MMASVNRFREFAWRWKSELENESKLPEESTQIISLTNTIDIACKEVRAISHQMMPRILQEDGLIPALEDMLEKSFQFSTVNL